MKERLFKLWKELRPLYRAQLANDCGNSISLRQEAFDGLKRAINALRIAKRERNRANALKRAAETEINNAYELWRASELWRKRNRAQAA